MNIMVDNVASTLSLRSLKLSLSLTFVSFHFFGEWGPPYGWGLRQEPTLPNWYSSPAHSYGSPVTDNVLTVNLSSYYISADIYYNIMQYLM